MTLLEATVEIVKALVPTTIGSQIDYLCEQAARQQLLTGISQLYDTLKKLEAK